MSRIVKVKNNTGTAGTWAGQTIGAGQYYTLDTSEYNVWNTDANVMVSVGNGTLVVNKGADNTDDMDPIIGWNWLKGDTQPLSEVGTKLWVHESSKPAIPGKSFTTIWTGAGDDINNHVLGGGDILIVETSAGVNTTSKEVLFDPTFGDVYLHEGYVQWSGAGWGDYINVEVVAKATAVQTSTNKNYNIVNHKIVATAPGTGTHGLAGTPVFVPNTAGTGWWDLNGATPAFNVTQTGAYDWYDIDVVVARFMNKVPVYGSSANYIMLQSADAAHVPPGYAVRVTAFNNSSSSWKAWMIMTLYRERSI
jgi:hypothetical protein